LALVAILGYALIYPRYGIVVASLFWIVELMIWVLFIMDTWCDYYLEDEGRGCIRKVYGKFRGCFAHDRLKHDAMWAAIGRRNPGMAFRLTWGIRPQPGRRLGGDPEPATDRDGEPISERNVRRGAYDVSMLVFTFLGTAGTVIALFLPK
jgi:hypothetical protein